MACKFPANGKGGTISSAAMGEVFEQGGWKLQVSADSSAKAGASFASGVAKVK